jgi:ADP-dependent NAD(P)H-hydrate dehydratase / NAD(P)H-hydrate epimerase
MIPILSRAQIRGYDERAIACGVPSLVLMENAGRGAAAIAEGLVPSGEVVVVCGRGNNGGDGFVVARHLMARGRSVRVFALAAQLEGDARHNLEAFSGLGGDVAFLDDDFTALRDALASAALVVDALFGTGLARPVEGRYRAAIEAINEASALRLALDIPSGIDADTGAILGLAVRADHTATFAHRKCGLVQGPGADHAGAIHVVDLGIPDASVLAAVGHTARLLEAPRLPARRPDLHKYGAGSVLVAAGSPGKAGAALLAARGALRAGAGLVTIATFADDLEARLPEAMTVALDDDPAPKLEAALARSKAAGVGPGIGLGEEARAAIEAMMTFAGPLVLDADAITAFAGRPEALREAPGPRILTPHTGELARLLGTTSAAIEAHRFAAAKQAADRTGAIVVLKGWRSVIAGAELTVCDRGDPVLAVGGSGDVLTGIITALTCALPPYEAACAGVYLHARTGELWRERHGADRGVFAHELAELVPAALAELA